MRTLYSVLMPRPLSVWLSPVEAGVLISILLYTLTLYFARQNNILLRRLVALHETRF